MVRQDRAASSQQFPDEQTGGDESVATVHAAVNAVRPDHTHTLLLLLLCGGPLHAHVTGYIPQTSVPRRTSGDGDAAVTDDNYVKI